jgi:hypothetical protein
MAGMLNHGKMAHFKAMNKSLKGEYHLPVILSVTFSAFPHNIARHVLQDDTVFKGGKKWRPSERKADDGERRVQR